MWQRAHYSVIQLSTQKNQKVRLLLYIIETSITTDFCLRTWKEYKET